MMHLRSRIKFQHLSCAGCVMLSLNLYGTAAVLRAALSCLMLLQPLNLPRPVHQRTRKRPSPEQPRWHMLSRLLASPSWRLAGSRLPWSQFQRPRQNILPSSGPAGTGGGISECQVADFVFCIHKGRYCIYLVTRFPVQVLVQPHPANSTLSTHLHGGLQPWRCQLLGPDAACHPASGKGKTLS